MRTLECMYFNFLVFLLHAKIKLFYFIFFLKDKLYENIENDVESLNEYADYLLNIE